MGGNEGGAARQLNIVALSVSKDQQATIHAFYEYHSH